jgi:hypothetical protein
MGSHPKTCVYLRAIDGSDDHRTGFLIHPWKTRILKLRIYCVCRSSTGVRGWREFFTTDGADFTDECWCFLPVDLRQSVMKSAG